MTSVTPGDKATGFDYAATIAVTFSAPVDPATLTTGAIQLSTGGGTPFVGRIAYESATLTAKVTAPLLPGQTYQATVAATVKSATGTALGTAYTWRFNTLGTFGIDIAGIRPAGTSTNASQVHVIGPGTPFTPPGYDPQLTRSYEVHATCTARVAACSARPGWELTDIDTGYWSQGSAQVYQDQHLVLHVVHVAETPVPSSSTPGQLVVRYGTCSSGCTRTASWSFVTIQTVLNGTADGLLVDGDGTIHALISQVGPSPFVRHLTCSAGCVDAASWTTTDLFVGTPAVVQGFVRDAAGKLRVLAMPNEQSHLLATCSGRCAQAADWQVTTLAIGGIVLGRFGVEADGSVQLGMHTAAGETIYAACPANCSAPSSWTTVRLGSSPQSGGVFFKGATGRSFVRWYGTDARWYLAACDAGCDSASGWSSIEFGVGEVYLDSEGHLRSAGYPSGVSDPVLHYVQ